LRQILLAGLDDIVRFDKTFINYREAPGGGIELRFADGSYAACDLLVGADGGNSRVRTQFLPNAQRIDTGVVGIAGKLMLTDDNRRKAPASLLRGTGLVMAPGHCTMFIGLQEFSDCTAMPGAIGGNDDAYAAQPGALFDNMTSYLMWAYGGYRAEIEQERRLEELSAEELELLVLHLIENWHPDFREMVRLSDPSSLSVLLIRTSLPVDAWKTTRVRLIGDAIHSMTPYRGIGANVALRDAALLCTNLAAAVRGERTIDEAVHDYEEQMRNYGFAAVRSSLAAMQQAVADKGAGFHLRKLAFRAINTSPWLKRRFLASMGTD